jgi:hypothetical protein
MKQSPLVQAFWVLASTGALILAPGGIDAQVMTPGKIQVDGPRPLSAVVDELRKRHGVAITYEEAPRVSRADAKDITETIPVDRRQGDRRYYVPRGGPFTFTYTPPADTSDSSVEQMLNSLVDQYNAVSLDTQFRVARTGQLFHVIPAARRSGQGIMEPTQSPLDYRITIPNIRRSGLEQLTEIVDALRRAGHPAFGLGIIPLNAFRAPISGGVDNETARQALIRVIDSFPIKFDWVLLCGAVLESECALSLRPRVQPGGAYNTFLLTRP